MAKLKESFLTKRAFIEAVERGIPVVIQSDKEVPADGEIFVDGTPYIWTAIVELKNGLIVSIN